MKEISQNIHELACVTRLLQQINPDQMVLKFCDQHGEYMGSTPASLPENLSLQTILDFITSHPLVPDRYKGIFFSEVNSNSTTNWDGQCFLKPKLMTLSLYRTRRQGDPSFPPGLSRFEMMCHPDTTSINVLWDNYSVKWESAGLDQNDADSTFAVFLRMLAEIPQ